MALLVAPHEGFTDSRLRLVQAGDDAFGEEDGLHAPANTRRRRVKIEPDGGDLTRWQSEEGDRRPYRESAQRFSEIEDVVSGDGLGLLHRRDLVAIEGEDRVGGSGLGRGGKRRRLEGEAARQQR